MPGKGIHSPRTFRQNLKESPEYHYPKVELVKAQMKGGSAPGGKYSETRNT